MQQTLFHARIEVVCSLRANRIPIKKHDLNTIESTIESGFIKKRGPIFINRFFMGYFKKQDSFAMEFAVGITSEIADKWVFFEENHPY